MILGIQGRVFSQTMTEDEVLRIAHETNAPVVEKRPNGEWRIGGRYDRPDNLNFRIREAHGQHTDHYLLFIDYSVGVVGASISSSRNSDVVRESVVYDGVDLELDSDEESDVLRISPDPYVQGVIAHNSLLDPQQPQPAAARRLSGPPPWQQPQLDERISNLVSSESSEEDLDDDLPLGDLQRRAASAARALSSGPATANVQPTGRKRSTQEPDVVLNDKKTDVVEPKSKAVLTLMAEEEYNYSTDIDSVLNCPICLQKVSESIETACSHLFCSACITNIISGQCPICRCDLGHWGPKRMSLDEHANCFMLPQSSSRNWAADRMVVCNRAAFVKKKLEKGQTSTTMATQTD